MKRKLMAVLLAGMGFSTLAMANPDKVWITLGEMAYSKLQQVAPHAVAKSSKSFATSHLPGIDGQQEQVHVVEVDEKTMLELSDVIHHELRRCGGYMAHDSYEEAMKSLEPVVPAKATKPSYVINNQDIVNPLLPLMSDTLIASTIIDLSSFTNRYYTSRHGVAASDWIRTKWQNLANGRTDVTVEQITHPNWAQKSVMLTIRGQTKPDEIVVIGGHIDSIRSSGMTAETIAPGADDDASGVATMTEVIRVMMEKGYKPNRTIKFIGYAAEEVGLRGSKEIAQRFKSQNANVVGVMQLDMTNYKGSANDIYIFTDYTNAEQNTFLTNIIKTYLPTLKIGQDRCGYACSDHASWYNQGYAASMPFEASMSGGSPYIHTANDTFASTGNQAQHALKFARMAMAYAVELGSDNDTPPPGGIDETHQGSLAAGQMVNFGPYRLTAGTSFSATMTGTGDADLYLRKGAPPTRSTYDCRPYRGDSQETCTLTATTATDVYLMIDGYKASTYTLKVKSVPPAQ